MTDMEFIETTIKKINAKQYVSKNDIIKAMNLVHVVSENKTATCTQAELMTIGGLLSAALSKIN